MTKYSATVAALILVICIGLAPPSHAQAMGNIRVTVVKAGLVAGAEFWRDHLQPEGYTLRAMVVDWPEGMPGDIGFFVGCDDDAKR